MGCAALQARILLCTLKHKVLQPCSDYSSDLVQVDVVSLKSLETVFNRRHNVLAASAVIIHVTAHGTSDCTQPTHTHMRTNKNTAPTTNKVLSDGAALYMVCLFVREAASKGVQQVKVPAQQQGQRFAHILYV